MCLLAPATAPRRTAATGKCRGAEVLLLCAVVSAVWETEESDRTLLSWRQLAVFPLAG